MDYKNEDTQLAEPSKEDRGSHSKVTTSTGEAYIDRHTATIVPAFTEDPVINYMLSSLTPARRAVYQPHYMHVLLRASMLNAGVFVEADDWSCVAVWMPPGKRIDSFLTLGPAGFVGVLWNLGLSGCRRMLLEFSGQADKLKRKNLVNAQTGRPLKKFHYLWFIATAEEARGRGLASHLIRLRQEVARSDGLPIWLEATTTKSRDVYVRCGFRTVGEIKLGVGKHASSGLMDAGGSGVTVYGMMWRPEWQEMEASQTAQVT